MALSRRAFPKTGVAGAAYITRGVYTLPGPQSAAVVPWTALERTVVAVPAPATSPALPPTDIAQFARRG